MKQRYFIRLSCVILVCAVCGFTQTISAAPAPAAGAGKAKPNPQSLELNEKGVVAVNSKNFTQAEDLFRQSLTADPYNLTAVFNLAGMYIANKKDEAAVSLLEDYVKRYPGDAGLHARLGDAYFGTKQFEKAQGSYQTALKLDPKYPKVNRRLATLFLFKEKLPEAERTLLAAVNEDPRDGEALGNLSSVQLALGKHEQAIGSAKRALQLKPSSEVYVTLGTAYELTKSYKNSLIAFQRAIDLGDTRPELKSKVDELQKLAGLT